MPMLVLMGEWYKCAHRELGRQCVIMALTAMQKAEQLVNSLDIAELIVSENIIR